MSPFPEFKLTGMREWRCEEGGQKGATAVTSEEQDTGREMAPRGQDEPDTDAEGWGLGSCAFQALQGGEC